MSRLLLFVADMSRWIHISIKTRGNCHNIAASQGSCEDNNQSTAAAATDAVRSHSHLLCPRPLCGGIKQWCCL